MCSDLDAVRLVDFRVLTKCCSLIWMPFCLVVYFCCRLVVLGFCVRFIVPNCSLLIDFYGFREVLCSDLNAILYGRYKGLDQVLYSDLVAILFGRLFCCRTVVLGFCIQFLYPISLGFETMVV